MWDLELVPTFPQSELQASCQRMSQMVIGKDVVVEMLWYS